MELDTSGLAFVSTPPKVRQDGALFLGLDSKFCASTVLIRVNVKLALQPARIHVVATHPLPLPRWKLLKVRSGADQLQIKHLLQLGHSLLGVLHCVAHSPRVFVNLPVVAALVGFVAEEVNGLVFHAVRHVLLVLNVLQAVRLIPALREDVK